MRHYQSWSPYVGGSAIVLAVVLLIVTGVLLLIAVRLPRPLKVHRPGLSVGILIVVIWFLSVLTFLVAVTVYVNALYQQVGSYTGPGNPITPVTVISAALSFIAIFLFTRRSGLWVAVGSATVGTIAAPMIFELPFDNIVMWRTYPPSPETLFTLLFFLPLFLVEISSFAMLLLSPVVMLSRVSLFLLAGMFFVFAIWALFGFAYPSTPLSIALNVMSKILAFAVAVSLFMPPDNLARVLNPARIGAEAQTQTPYSSGLM